MRPARGPAACARASSASRSSTSSAAPASSPSAMQRPSSAVSSGASRSARVMDRKASSGSFIGPACSSAMRWRIAARSRAPGCDASCAWRILHDDPVVAQAVERRRDELGRLALRGPARRGELCERRDRLCVRAVALDTSRNSSSARSPCTGGSSSMRASFSASGTTSTGLDSRASTMRLSSTRISSELFWVCAYSRSSVLSNARSFGACASSSWYACAAPA